MSTFGCHMIVKDAEDVLLPILEVSHLFDQFVIVDTGSTDGTIELIKQYPHVTLAHFEWNNNFADARNYALGLVDTYTFMWLDADDVPTAEDVEAWREVADFLASTNHNMYQLKYIYASDNFNNPLLVQYRERIFVNPADWHWNGAIHETLEWVYDRECYGLVSDEYPVVHKPLRKPGDKDRNWTILRQSYLIDGKRDPNTLYYAQKEACGRGQDELAVVIGQELVAMNLEDYKHWEGLKHLGDSYTRLGKQDAKFYELAEKYYWDAIDATQGKFNEPIFALIECRLIQNKVNEAIEALELLNYFPPKNETVCLDKYGPATFTFEAWVLSHKGFTQFDGVMHHYLQGSDTEVPIPLGFTVLQWLNEQIELNRVGVIYADEDAECMQVAAKVRKMMLSTDMFNHVHISTSPLCASFANGVYFHITKSDHTLYQEETNPKVLKVLVADNITAYGYAVNHPIPANDEEFDALMSAVYPYVDVIVTQDLEDGLRQVRASRARYTIITCEDMTEELASEVIEQTLEGYQNPIIWERMCDGRIYTIAGRTKDVQGLSVVDNNLILHVPHRIKYVDIYPAEPFYVYSQLPDHPRRKVVIYAEGIESWNGCTPHTTGIGGSESSVIYLAEELAKTDRVIVLCTTDETRTINGVFYASITQLEKLADVDVFISSRCPEVVKERRGKRQFLWLHDVAQSYDLDDIIVDKVITVSDREACKVTHMTPKPVITIPNGIHTDCHHEERVEGRCIWTSSPDRGLTNLLESQIKDMWITYSWAGINHCFKTSCDIYRRTLREKALIRKRGWKIVGRLAIDELRELLSTCQYWPYLSTFEESFCINVLETVNQGVIPLICEEAGAAPETFMQYCHGYRNSYDYIIEKHCMIDYIDGLVTKRETIAPYDDTLITTVEVAWDTIANKWKSLF